MGDLWIAHRSLRLPMGCPWVAYGAPTGHPWVSHWFTVLSRGSPIGHPSGAHGSNVGVYSCPMDRP